MSLSLTLNGESRSFEALDGTLRGEVSVEELVLHLGLKTDRVAIERNGEIVPRRMWGATRLADGDRLELVHFVGGGLVEGRLDRVLAAWKEQ